MGKSVTGALIGTLVETKRLGLDAPAPVAAWRGAGDPRGAITLRQLLIMTSGLKFDERYVPGDDALPMLFFSRDMAAYAAGQPLVHPPGKTWAYSSGTSNILSKLVLDQSGGSLKSVTDYARQVLFEPAGMTSAVLEADPSGTPVGSSYLYATARDWARFGLLYQNDGVLDRRRILPASWVAFSRAPNGAEPQGTYGGQFWLNAGAGDGANRPFKDCPRDLYAARGHNGQIVAIVPSRDAVIVRLGWTPDGRDFDANRHISRILAALGQ
jgi:CubicO group peptidase (beta-lactamase class C family)